MLLSIVTQMTALAEREQIAIAYILGDVVEMRHGQHYLAGLTWYRIPLLTLTVAELAVVEAALALALAPATAAVADAMANH